MSFSRLAWEIDKRTSIDTDKTVAHLTLESPAIFNEPLLVWQGSEAFAPPSPLALSNLRRHLQLGGSLLVDSAAPPFTESVESVIRSMFSGGPILAPLPASHVLFKSFYLLNDSGGRRQQAPPLLALQLDGRLAVVIVRNDLTGALARNAVGDWLYEVEGGARQREMTVRFGVNWLMYLLCLDYKDDQVHLPFILQRRH